MDILWEDSILWDDVITWDGVAYTVSTLPTDITTTFDHPFSSATYLSGSPSTPSFYPIALAGRGFLLDTASQTHHHQSIPVLKPQQDTNNQVSESSINPESLWRRSQTSWHKGAGQTYLDKPESDSAKFRSSLGIDALTVPGEITLLPNVDFHVSIPSANVFIASAGEFLYIAYGSSLVYYQDLSNTPTFVPINAGEGIYDIQSITSDGYQIYVADSINGIHTTVRGSATGNHYNALQANILSYVSGRLMAASGASIYNITSADVPDPLFTHPNRDFIWVDFTEGEGEPIYAAGYSGDKSLIYKVTIESDGTSLAAPVVVARLPDGEIVTAIQSYLGFLCIGTTTGLRFAEIQQSSGNLTLGAIIEIGHPVRAFEGQGRFIWFGWSNFDYAHTGLGKLDLSTISTKFAPAYCSDLMAPYQGEVMAITTWKGKTVFSVAGLGLFSTADEKVSSGWLRSGLISYNTPEDKVAVFLDVRYREFSGSHTISLARSDEEFTAVGYNTPLISQSQFEVNGFRAELLEIQNTLHRDNLDSTKAPVLTRHTLECEVTANTREYIFLPLLLSEHIVVRGQELTRDVADDLAFIKSLRRDRYIFPAQEGSVTYQCVLDDYNFAPTHLNSDSTAYQGTCVVKLKVVKP